MSTAVTTTTTTDTLRGMLAGDEFKRAVSQVLPKHLTPDRFVRVAILAMTRTPKLAQCEKASFFGSLMTLSQLGIEPDGRRAHLIPFENRKRGVVECQLIVDYKGIAELVQRSGLVSNLHADVVCENDEFEFNCGEVTKHKIDFRKPRGLMYAAYAMARMKDGSNKCEVMGRDEIYLVRDKSSGWKAFKAGYAKESPWADAQSEPEMWKKTAFRRLSKWLPWSPEIRDAIEKDEEPIEVTTTTVSTVDPLAGLLGAIPEAPAEPENVAAFQVPPPNPQPERDVRSGPASPPMEPWEKLGITVEEAGHTFEQFKAWAALGGIITDIGTAKSWKDVNNTDANRVLRSKAGMLNALALAEGGAK